MKRKVLSVVLLLALLAGGVGLGIHLLHKDAFALQSFRVKMVVEGQGGIPGLDVEFHFQYDDGENPPFWGDWHNAFDEQDGHYNLTYAGEWEVVQWEVKFPTTDGYNGVNPDGNWCNFAFPPYSFTWVIEEI